MKNLAVSMLAMASIAAMVSCSSNNDPVDEVGNGEKVEIKLSAGVGAITTKATETTLSNNPTIYLLREDLTSSTTPTWENATPQSYNLSSNGLINLNTEQKYYDKEGKNSFFIGYTPQGTKEASKAQVNYTSFDGESDILCSNQVDAGTKTNVATSAELSFRHMLSQVIINVEGVSTNVANTFGTIENISITNVPSALTLSLGETASIAQNGSETTSYVILNNTTNKDFETIKSALSPKFVIPGLGTESSPLSLKIETTKFKAEKAITVSIKDITTIVNAENKTGLLAGYKHTITLTFKDNITITASIQGIEEGGSTGEDIGK